MYLEIFCSSFLISAPLPVIFQTISVHWGSVCVTTAMSDVPVVLHPRNCICRDKNLLSTHNLSLSLWEETFFITR